MMMYILLQCFDLLLSMEAVSTIAAVIVVWCVIGGPMRHMKLHHKVFMFFVAASLLGAVLDKLNRLTAVGDIEVVVLAKAIVTAARLAMVISGVYVLAVWRQQCHRLAELARMANNRKLATAKPAGRHTMEDTATYTPIMG